MHIISNLHLLVNSASDWVIFALVSLSMLSILIFIKLFEKDYKLD